MSAPADVAGVSNSAGAAAASEPGGGDPQLAAVRVPPHSVEAEQSVLGGLMLDNTAWDRIADRIAAEDFYRHDHRLIFQQILRLVDQSKPADAVTVYEALQLHGQAKECGGLAYLNALAQNTPSAANVRRYAEIVRERAILRRLVTVGLTFASASSRICLASRPRRLHETRAAADEGRRAHPGTFRTVRVERRHRGANRLHGPGQQDERPAAR
jgi:hypothetical protein